MEKYGAGTPDNGEKAWNLRGRGYLIKIDCKFLLISICLASRLS